MSSADCLVPYEPLNTLKSVAPEVWIVDGPVIAMSWLGIGVPFTTRMTVIRLPDGGLILHSPTPINDALRGEIDELGPVMHIVAPNRIHYWWVGEWVEAYPQARTYAAPRIAEEASKHGRFHNFDETLGSEAPAAWADTIDQLLVEGGFLTEAVFFHRPSKTLILTDLIENFEPGRIKCWHWRLAMRAFGPSDPNGTLPKDLRFTFRKHRPAFRSAVQQMIEWQPERVLLAHGRWYDRDAPAELRRAFSWIL